MAVRIVGIVSAVLLVGEVLRWQDTFAAMFVIAAIATALLKRPT